MTTAVRPEVEADAVRWRFPAYVEHRLSNGLRVLVYSCPGQYVVAATLIFDVPLSAEPAAIEGVAGLTGRCLPRGAGDRTAEQFADALAACGADLDAGASTDAFTVRLSVPIGRLTDGLALLAEAVAAPRLEEAEIEHERRLRLREIEQAAAYPQHVAVEQLNAALFGSARAARPAGGTAETVAAVTRDDLVAYAAAHLAPGTTTLVLAGDLSADDALAEAERAFAGWTADATVSVRHQPAVPARRPQVVLVDWPAAAQATIRVAGPGIPRADRRWASLFVANHAVGGSFSSRVNTVLRERKGVTYGAGSALDSSRGTGLVTLSTAVRPDATADALRDIVTLLAKAGGTLTADEVSTGSRAATQSAALGFERADSVAARAELMLAQALPLTHVDENLSALQAVTPEAANAAWTEIVRPEELTIVVVADAASLASELAAWNYGEIIDVTPRRR